MATLQDYLGITALRDAWPKWKANVIAINNQVIAHVAGTANKHSAQDITYTGDFVGKTEVKAALDQAKTEIDTIVVNASVDPEVALARDSTVKGETFDTLDARLEESEQDLVTYKADNALQLGLKATQSDLDIMNGIVALKTDKDYVDALTQGLVSGSPKAYATLALLQADFPSGDNSNYVVVADGNWYYWSGSAWTPGGLYLASNQKRLPLTWSSGFISSINYSSDAGTIQLDETHKYSNLIHLVKGTTILIHAIGSINVLILSLWRSNNTFLKSLIIGDGVTADYSYTVTGDDEYLRVCDNTSMITIDSVYVEVISTFVDIDTSILGRLQQIEEGIASLLTYTSGHYVGLTGTIGDGSNYHYSNIVAFTKGDKLLIHASCSGSALILSKWTGVGGAFVSALIVGDGSIGVDVPVYEYTVKDDIEYLRFVNNSALLPMSEVYIKKTNGSLLEVVKRVEVVNSRITSHNPQQIRQPVINFIFDDGNTSDAVIKSLLQTYGFVCGFALITTVNRDGEYLADQVDGFEILSHSIDGTSMSDGAASIATIENKFKTSKSILEGRGFNVTGWVTPASQLNAIYLPSFKKHYEFGFTDYLGTWNTGLGEDPFNKFSEDSRSLKRVSMQSTLESDCLLAIDTVIANGEGMLTFYAHGYPDGTALPSTKMIAILDYVKAKVDAGDCLVLTPTDAYRHLYTLRHSDYLALLP